MSKFNVNFRFCFLIQSKYMLLGSGDLGQKCGADVKWSIGSSKLCLDVGSSSDSIIPIDKVFNLPKSPFDSFLIAVNQNNVSDHSLAIQVASFFSMCRSRKDVMYSVDQCSQNCSNK